MIDKDEYPQTAEIESRCVEIIADLWNAPPSDRATGCSTTGSSEAAMLGGLALKWRWRERMRAAGRPSDAAEPRRRASTSRSAGRSSAATGTSSRVSCRWRATATRSAPPRRRRCATRTRSASPRSSARPSTAATSRSPRSPRRSTQLERERRHRRPDPRRRRLRRLHRAVPPAGPRVGLPDPAGAVDQRLRAQVRARLPGRRLGAVARPRRAAEGSDLRRQLPRRPHAHLRAQLLAARERGGRPVPHVHEPRPRGLPRGPAALGRHRAPDRRRDREDRPLRADQRRERPAGVRVQRSSPR